MSRVIMRKIETYLHNNFWEKIDLSDCEGRPDRDIRDQFLSRAIAAFAVQQLANVTPLLASKSITDGFEDNGLDAVLFDSNLRILFLVNSKWIASGKGTIPSADIKKFVKGVEDLLYPRMERFNARLQARQQEVEEALNAVDTHIELIVVHTGDESVSRHCGQDLDDLAGQVNDTGDVLKWQCWSQKELYSALIGQLQGSDIDLDVDLFEWGKVDSPYEAYYGQAEAAAIAAWWRQHRDRLFARNIRNYKGRTDVNRALGATLSNAPHNLWYFNNGITITAKSVKKTPRASTTRSAGTFVCRSASVVNGAQTVGIIGSHYATQSAVANGARVLVRLISLEDCPQGFDVDVTHANNTQNRIMSSDFAALDPHQRRIAEDLALDDITYAYKTGAKPPHRHRGFELEEATIALACSMDDPALAVQAKAGIGKLWENTERAPYRLLFNDSTDAAMLWKKVQVYRIVDSTITRIPEPHPPRLRLTGIHGNRIILHCVFRDPLLRLDSYDVMIGRDIAELAPQLAIWYLLRTKDYIDRNLESSYIPTVFKNTTKCTDLCAYLLSVREKTRLSMPIFEDISRFSPAQTSFLDHLG